MALSVTERASLHHADVTTYKVRYRAEVRYPHRAARVSKDRDTAAAKRAPRPGRGTSPSGLTLSGQSALRVA